MVERWCLVVFIFFLAHAKFWGNIRVVQRPVFETAIIECSGNANGSNGVQTVGVLNDIQFDRRECFFRISALERDVFDDVDDVLDGGLVHVMGFQKFSGDFGPYGFVSVMKLAVGNIVKQGSQFYDVNITNFAIGNQQGIFIHAFDVKPVVSTFGIFEFLLYKKNGFVDYGCISHIWDAFYKKS